MNGLTSKLETLKKFQGYIWNITVLWPTFVYIRSRSNINLYIATKSIIILNWFFGVCWFYYLNRDEWKEWRNNNNKYLNYFFKITVFSSTQECNKPQFGPKRSGFGPDQTYNLQWEQENTLYYFVIRTPWHVRKECLHYYLLICYAFLRTLN